MFLGDGMSIPTISATRVYLGGEEKDLAFDTFPFTGLSKVITSGSVFLVTLITFCRRIVLTNK